MHALRTATAFFAGFGLYYAAVVFTGGILAAVATPRGYFAFFGQDQPELALAVLFLFRWAIPVGVLVAAGTLAINRLLSRRGYAVWGPALAGMVASFSYWALVSVGYFTSREQAHLGLAQALSLAFTAQWWNVANDLAPWLGFTFAVWLSRRTNRQSSSSGA